MTTTASPLPDPDVIDSLTRAVHALQRDAAKARWEARHPNFYRRSVRQSLDNAERAEATAAVLIDLIETMTPVNAPSLV